MIHGFRIRCETFKYIFSKRIFARFASYQFIDSRKKSRVS